GLPANHRAIVAQLLEHAPADGGCVAPSEADSRPPARLHQLPTPAGTGASSWRRMPAGTRGAQPTEACLVLASLADSAELIATLWLKSGAPRLAPCRQGARSRMKLLELGAPVTPSEAAAPAGPAKQRAPSPDALACLRLRPAGSPAGRDLPGRAAVTNLRPHPLSSNSTFELEIDADPRSAAAGRTTGCRTGLFGSMPPLPMLVACYKLLMHGGPFLPKEDPELKGRCYADLVRAYLLRQPNRSADALLQDCPPRLAVAALAPSRAAVLEAALQGAGAAAAEPPGRLLPAAPALLPGCQLDPLAFCLLTEDLESALLLLLLAGASPAYLRPPGADAAAAVAHRVRLAAPESAAVRRREASNVAAIAIRYSPTCSPCCRLSLTDGREFESSAADADLVDLVSRALRLEESSADDPEDQPYKSRYEARKLLNEAISIVNAEGFIVSS
uniref:ANK_REP_REGION domain-containing protein n=1 Tax=Macrostomum lignano TaxID=282301 RepID=A0A1I8FFY8_9PLAT